MGITWNHLGRVRAGSPMQFAGKVSEEETLVSTVRHTDLVRQISRQTLKLCTGKTAHELPWFWDEKMRNAAATCFVEMCFLNDLGSKGANLQTVLLFQIKFSKILFKFKWCVESYFFSLLFSSPSILTENFLLRKLCHIVFKSLLNN